MKHNHLTRDIKPPGQCPGCDDGRAQSPDHCPDCGSDDIHSEGCRRVFPSGDPREDLQFGPPWQPWREEAQP